MGEKVALSRRIDKVRFRRLRESAREFTVTRPLSDVSPPSCSTGVLLDGALSDVERNTSCRKTTKGGRIAFSRFLLPLPRDLATRRRTSSLPFYDLLHVSFLPSAVLVHIFASPHPISPLSSLPSVLSWMRVARTFRNAKRSVATAQSTHFRVLGEGEK